MKFSLLFITTFLFVAILITQFSFLIPVAEAAPRLQIKTKEDLISKVICPIARLMFIILMIVGIIMVLWAAYLYATSSGNPEKVSKATHALIYAALGIGLGFFAFLIPPLTGSILGVTIGNVCNIISGGAGTPPPPPSSGDDCYDPEYCVFNPTAPCCVQTDIPPDCDPINPDERCYPDS